MKKEEFEIYTDDVGQRITDDRERLRKRTTMYIGNRGVKGITHLAREVINNSIDECLNTKSPGDTIDVIINTTENKLTVSDNGRGIPFDDIIPFCTEIQAGTKMERDSLVTTAGENGLGLTATNALSSYFEIISRRYGERKTVIFEDGGNLVSEKITKIKGPNVKEARGTTVSFIPSVAYMSSGKEKPIFDPKLIIDWIERIAYTLPENMVTSFSVVNAGKTTRKVFTNKKGMKGYLSHFYPNILFEPLHVKATKDFTETITKYNADGSSYDQEVPRYTSCELALSYVPIQKDTVIVPDSYCNIVRTVDGGSHLEAAEKAIINVIRSFVRDTFNAREKEKWKIRNLDILEGLQISLSVMTSLDPGFTSQVKEKVDNPTLGDIVQVELTEKLREALVDNPKLTKKITDAVRANIRARMSAEKVRVTGAKPTSIDVVELGRNDKFIPCRSMSTGGYAELVIVEGLSAGGAMLDYGFPDFQAGLQLRGVPINPLARTTESVMKNAEFALLTEIIGSGFGDKFDLSKCPFDKIIIDSDKDSDGGYIFSLLIAFFIKFMRPLIEDGRVYRGMPPLYKIRDDERPFILDKTEYFNIYHDRIINTVIVTSDEFELDDSSLRGLIEATTDYVSEIDKLVKFYSVNPKVLEIVIKATLDFKINSPKWMKFVKSYIPEAQLEGNVFHGIYEGEYQLLYLNDSFMERIIHVARILTNPMVPGLFYSMRHKEGKRINDDILTLHELLSEFTRHMPVIDKRIKGLGELNGSELREYVLHPNHRILVKVTVDDIDEAIDLMNAYHGKDGEHRKELLSNLFIHPDELDN